MKKLISIFLAVLLAFALPITAFAEAKNLGEVEVKLYENEQVNGEKLSVLLNVLDEMVEQGNMYRPSWYQGYDLDRDGNTDVSYSAMSTGDCFFGAYRDANLSGVYSVDVPESVKNTLKGAGKVYCDKIVFLFENEWRLRSDAYINGVKVSPSETIKLEKGSKLFVCFDTDERNVDHGYAPLVGFADNYPGGMLSSAGFVVKEGSASDFGFNSAEWGFGSDPHGSLIEAGNLAPGTIGHLDYFLYECDNFDWGTFDFVNTPRAFIQTLTFEVEDHHWDGGKVTAAATYAATGTKTYTCTVCQATKNETLPKLAKLANPLSVKTKAVKLSAAKLKKKSLTINCNKALTISNAKGKVTYAKVKGAKGINVNKKTGKFTIKKKLKKGTYRVSVRVTAAGSSEYNQGAKTVTVKIVVK